MTPERSRIRRLKPSFSHAQLRASFGTACPSTLNWVSPSTLRFDARFCRPRSVPAITPSGTPTVRTLGEVAGDLEPLVQPIAKSSRKKKTPHGNHVRRFHEATRHNRVETRRGTTCSA